jgi:hypothetical protein
MARIPSLRNELQQAVNRCEMVARDPESYFGGAVTVTNRISNDQARAYVRMLSEETEKLARTTLLGTVATVATIALEQKITARQVRNWTSG